MIGKVTMIAVSGADLYFCSNNDNNKNTKINTVNQCISKVTISYIMSIMACIMFDIKSSMDTNLLLPTKNLGNMELALINKCFIFLDLTLLYVICFSPLLITSCIIKLKSMLNISWYLISKLIFRRSTKFLKY